MTSAAVATLPCDMLVPLYRLPPHQPTQAPSRLCVRKALLTEKGPLVEWADLNFPYWRKELESSVSGHPVNCWFATLDGELIGACAFDVIALGVVGPLATTRQGAPFSVGRKLLLEALHEMRVRGYGYAVLGWISGRLQPYYARVVGARPIPDSAPECGLYREFIR